MTDLALHRPSRATMLQLLRGLVPLAVGLVIALAALLRPVLAEPPFAYSGATYAPEQAALCPGEALSWTPVITIRATPARPLVVGIVRTVWDVASQRTAVTDQVVEHTVYRQDVEIRQRMRYAVPELPPGPYELITARVAEGYYAQSYAVAFTVRGDCEAGDD